MMNLKKEFNKQALLEKNGEFSKSKLKDFLISEIEEDTLEDTITFLKCEIGKENEKLKEDLYHGDKYNGVILDGNQYLIKKEGKQAIIIDAISEEHSKETKFTRFELPIDTLLYVIINKDKILEEL
ncbi:hypothetical protein [Bacillus sp. 166amftsu]|uniref:hypothetical protein n=1 Tax=Bacillus sp. 166amftsu TaxID=1761753 RepID=UPI000B87EE39|nr:hypothetical protein [Bacillus sp. 166amftsu]